jgi:hypothetical protein
MLKKVTLLGATLATAFAMHVGEVNINNDDIEASVKLDMGQFNNEIDVDTTYIGFRYIYTDEDDLDGLFELSFLMQKPLDQMKDLRIGIGFKLDYTSVGSNDFLALPLGIEGLYRLPFDASIVPVYVGGKFYYAPSVLSFQDADSYLEFKLHADIEVIERGMITLGYRHIDTDYEAGDVEFNDAFYLGFKFAF